MLGRLCPTAVGLALILAFVAEAAAELPKATQKVLSELKLDAALMDGLDGELSVPQA